MKLPIIPFQLPIQPVLPTIEGNVDYQLMRQQFLRIDELLVQSGWEAQFIETSVAAWLAKCQQAKHTPSAQAQLRFQQHARQALRCNIARVLMQEDFRGFASRLADSPLLQRFSGISQLDRIVVPSKSTLQRYSQWWPESEVRDLVEKVLRAGQQNPQPLDLAQPLDRELYFLDTTCVKANIHFPVDWVLLRDATRTLMKAVRLIREQGLKHRMEQPEEFVRRMNRLCLEMVHARAKADSRRQRKRVWRKMDRLMGVIRGHAQRYRQLLDQQWEKTAWTRPQAEQVLRRMDQVLKLLPAARRQARQRILEEQMVENREKILNLYEPEVRVIVRQKAGAEVEFGNTLLLGESPQGLILDWKLFREIAPADSRLVVESVERMEQAYGKLKAMGTDRGFDSEGNREELQTRGIYNAICPRDPRELKRRSNSWKFKRLQRRRAQTEGRVAIFKNQFLGKPLRSKGFANRNLAVSWGVLVHNLWVIARLPRRTETEQLAA
ncbi:MAG: hypothetical protein L0312_30565 [Acidobacteria bacterium]|nr:hypothetical protein [Acidobacteriota bacterium]